MLTLVLGIVVAVTLVHHLAQGIGCGGQQIEACAVAVDGPVEDVKRIIFCVLGIAEIIVQRDIPLLQTIGIAGVSTELQVVGLLVEVVVAQIAWRGAVGIAKVAQVEHA